MADLFRGYIKSKGKKPLSSIKGGDWLKEPPTDSDYVGVLKENIIQVDFDDSDSAELAMKIVKENKMRCDILKTTRGVHLYFLDDGSTKTQCVHLYNAIGLPCDIGLGKKDRVIPLRITKDIEQSKIVNGEEVVFTTKEVQQREWLQTYDELDNLPCIFRIIGKHDYKFEDCTERNQTLFSYILQLQTHNFTKNEVRKTIKMINKYRFKSPLSDKEIDAITRDDAFSEELFFTDKGAFLHDRFGNYMLTNSNIIRIDEQVNIYTKDNIYSNNPDDFEREMLRKIPTLKDTQRKEVYKYISLQCVKEGEFANPIYIGLGHTILDIQTMEEFPYSPKFIMNNVIKYDYNPNAYSEVMDKTLNKLACNDPQVRMLLEEMIGYTLYRKNSIQKAFILTGEGSNGKSTFLNCIKKLLGKGNFTSLDMSELEQTFKPAELYNKLANIGDDISAKYMDDTSKFKKCVTGESFLVERKYGQPFELTSYATQIFCANELPAVKDKSDGFGRRLIIIPFSAKFSKDDEDYDPFIEDKLLEDESIEYLLKIAIDGLRRVILSKEFTKSTKGELEKNTYLISNNSVLEWLEEAPAVENNSVNDCYNVYQVWCAQNGCNAVKKINFTKEIKKTLGLTSKPKTIDGKTVRVYVKED